jgi:cyclopropane fatty-acyl-phospholipid synthase-like methyltransferase
LIAERLREAGLDFEPGCRVLDFGCGCGRTIIWLTHEYPEVEFHGSDVDSEAIEWCRTHLLRERFETNAPLPPLRYPDGYFRAIYCLSVFTHLNESMQDAWLPELHRVLEPGGLFVLSVHGRNAARSLTADDVAALKAVGFLHKTSNKLRGIVPNWYHTTWYSRDYITNRLTDWFEGVSYFEVSDGLQDFIIGRSKSAPNTRSQKSA